MERLLMLRLQSMGCAAQAWLNDIPMIRTPHAGGALVVPVHEYVLEGDNDIRLVLEPTPLAAAAPPRIAAADLAANMRLLLPRVGRVGSESSARSLAGLDLAVPEGEVYTPGLQCCQSVVLPVKFPRWRWLDVPVIPDAQSVQPIVAAFVQNLAIALAKGDADAFLQAARLRFEETALAYQQPLSDLAARWRSRVQLLHATKALKLVVLPALNDVQVVPCAGGRLLECIAPDGEPILRTEAAADGSRHAWPIRVAVVEGHCHVMR
ncbi:MAG TPA: hypothetical protein VFP68_25230 [Burkholderiaceae bacterium]|nr:hypothetical protein [Burkholderiaceae bacterium]